MKKDRQVQVSKEQIEALKELINIGVGHGGEVLNSLLQSHIRLSVPKIEITGVDSMPSLSSLEADSELSAVEMKYRGSFSGCIQLIFPKPDAAKLVSLLAGENLDKSEMDEIHSGTLQEIGNILLNAVMGTISNFFSFTLRYSLPVYLEGNLDSLFGTITHSKPNIIIFARTRFTIDDMAIDGNLVLFFALETFDALMNKAMTYAGIN